MNDGVAAGLSRAKSARASTHEMRPTSIAARVLAVACVLVLAIACIAGVARLIAWSTAEQVSFDGAMNLGVARSLAEGHGYERLYGDRSGFSHEIQSRAPFILPAAATFAAFGVGVWQAQLTNLAYLAALLVVVFVLVQRGTSWRWALLAVATCLWTPGIREIAMNGYGEAPALAWWLAAVLVLSRRDDAPIAPARWLAAGLLAGTAVLTKTVLAIGLIAMLPLFVAAFVSERSRGRRALVGPMIFLAGVCLPAIAYEIAHVVALGDMHRWKAWLRDEVRAIHMQAGTEPGFKDTNGLGAKLVFHSRVLAENLGLPPALLPFWIALPMVAAIFARRALASVYARAAVVGLVVFTAVYFLWWLGFTPTEKAWYRRVFDGVLVLEIVLVFALAAVWKLRARMPRATVAAVFVALIALQVPLLWSNVGADDESDFSPASSLPADLAALQRVPPGAHAFGVGWYSSPILALYSGRHLGNLATRTPDNLASVSPVYLVLDAQAMRTGAAQYWLDRYPHRELSHSVDLALIELDARAPRDPFASMTIDDGALRDRVDFHAGDYPYIFGFQSREGDGWRWAMADSEVLLRYGGEPEFFVDIYLPAQDNYRFKRGVGITAWIGECRLGTFRQDTTGRERWSLPATNCPLRVGQRVAVRLTSDNVYEGHDDRQLGYIVHALGFVDSATDAAAAGAAQR